MRLLHSGIHPRGQVHDMKIDCYTICWNEEEFLPYFLRHYRTFCRSITVFDNQSTDRSRNLCRDAGASVVEWDTGNQQDNNLMCDIKNTCWKSSDADYVVVCDVDEIVCGLDRLLPSPNAVLRCRGWQMVGQGEPPELTRLALPDELYSKCAVFDPHVQALKYSCGCHDCTPAGHKGTIDSRLDLLHYSMRSEDNMVSRWKRYAARASAADRAAGWGAQYYLPEAEQRARYREARENAVQLPSTIIPAFAARPR